jgi:hypothetical protein
MVGDRNRPLGLIPEWKKMMMMMMTLLSYRGNLYMTHILFNNRVLPTEYRPFMGIV